MADTLLSPSEITFRSTQIFVKPELYESFQYYDYKTELDPYI